MTPRTLHDWTEAEVALVKKYQNYPSRKLHELLPHITMNALMARRRNIRKEGSLVSLACVNNVIDFDIASWRNDWDKPTEVRRMERVYA